MPNRWGNLILHTTALIYRKKNSLLTSHAARALLDVFIIIALEVFLGIISFPQYILVSSVQKEDGGAQYKIRRIITLSILMVIFLIWLIKILFIYITPLYFNTSNGFRVFNDQMVVTEEIENNYLFADVYNASVNEKLENPKIEKISIDKNRLIIEGLGKAKTFVNLYISKQDEISGDLFGVNLYLQQVDDSGVWKIQDINEKNFDLQPGKYWLKATTYDPELSQKTIEGVSGSFEIPSSALGGFLSHLDRYLNYFLILYISLGLFILILLVP